MGKSDPQAIRTWDLTTGEPIRGYLTQGEHPVSMALAPDGRFIASGDTEGMIRLRDASSGEVKVSLRAHGLAVGGLAFSPDGKYLASSSADSTVGLWQLPESVWPKSPQKE